MPKEFVHIRRVFIAAIAAAAVLQWAVVLERTWAALWAWYKFRGYGGGHIVVGLTTQVVFLSGSAVLAAVGYGLCRAESSGAGSGLWRSLNQFGWLSIAVCTLFWLAVLLSPLAMFYREAWQTLPFMSATHFGGSRRAVRLAGAFLGDYASS